MKTIAQLKSSLDKWFSYYIRLRDADDNGYVRCITCNKPVEWKYLDCGHFVPRQHLGTRFDERNCHGQCKGCNNKNWNQGEQYRHGKAIDKKYGEGTAEELDSVPRDSQKINKSEYEEKIKHYKQEVKRLLQEKGLSL